MAGEIQLSKFIPGSVPASELLGGPFQGTVATVFLFFAGRYGTCSGGTQQVLNLTAEQDAPSLEPVHFGDFPLNPRY
jgi:hypothetical protein